VLIARPARVLTVAPAYPRISAHLPEPAAGGEMAVALGGRFAAKRWIAITSAVVEPILSGASPHSAPPGSAFLHASCLEPIGAAPVERGEEKESRQEGGDQAETGTPPPIVEPVTCPGTARALATAAGSWLQS
jgi:hypothetical protein